MAKETTKNTPTAPPSAWRSSNAHNWRSFFARSQIIDFSPRNRVLVILGAASFGTPPVVYGAPRRATASRSKKGRSGSSGIWTRSWISSPSRVGMIASRTSSTR